MADRSPDAGSHCDQCDDYLNVQPGFTDQHDAWTCAECGNVNTISAADVIQVSDEDYD